MRNQNQLTPSLPDRASHASRLSDCILRLTSAIAWLLALSPGFLLFPTFTFALTGQVTNHTLSRPEPNIPVSYIHHDKSGATIVRDTTDQNGQFTLDVPSGPQTDPPPMLIARYNGIDYPGSPASGEGLIDISVYETTDQDTALSVASHHVLVDLTTRQATYILIVKNSGQHTYQSGGDHGHGLELPLPEGVTDILQAPEGVHLHGNVLVDPRPIIPGQSQSFFSFSLPPSNRLDQTITYNTTAFDLLLQPPESDVTTTGLHEHGPVTFGGKTFQQFAAADLTPGVQIGMAFGTAEDDLSQNAMIAIVVIVALGLCAIAVIMVRRRSAPTPSTAIGRRSALLEQIADLDDRFESGNISESIYKTRREVLKDEVLELSASRQSLLEQIADLDEQFERGELDKEQHQRRRDALKNRVANLADQG